MRTTSLMPRMLLAVAVAVALALSSCGGGDDDGGSEAPAGVPQPAEGQPIQFLTGHSKMTSDGCKANLLFSWVPVVPDSVPSGAEAVIDVKGPGLAGTYTRRADDSGRVTLELSTSVDRPRTSWTATLVSVDDDPVSAPPNSQPFLNTACGGKPTPASELPPGTPVPGAPCTPGQPLPPGFVCK